MKKEAVVFATAGAFFGLIVGWILGSQQAAGVRPVPAEMPAQQAQAAQAPPRLDQARVDALLASANQDATDVASRIELANLYFDAERYSDAIRWYREALALDPTNVDLSTDLGVSYFYANEPDLALEQFEHSLTVDPAHTKTLLNVGIVRAFGKQDLDGATAVWQQVVELAPDSPEGRTARQAIESIKAAHPTIGGS